VAEPGEGSEEERRHEPVMVAEVVEFLGRGRTVVDMTVGAGGHARALLEAGVGRVIGVDRDPGALRQASERLAPYGDRFRPVAGAFSAAPAAAVGEGRADGVLFDLGVSSMQLEDEERGFGYRADGPLDMRMDPSAPGPTAADLVNDLPEEELADLIFRYGEERQSRRVARAIVRARGRGRIETTGELAGVVAGALGRRPGRAHPARRTFQALRIAVNREIEELTTSLPWAASVLAPGGRVVVLSYHSLEDREVKRFLRDESTLRALTKRPLTASAEEVARNPRSRSAKLRAAEKVDPEPTRHFLAGSTEGTKP
jgi:16S rRNA (cytosine1402-N4)-methyltransferase